MLIEIPDHSLNTLQRDSIDRLLRDARGMHHADIVVRINGEDRTYQADWLRSARKITVIAADSDTEARREIG